MADPRAPKADPVLLREERLRSVKLDFLRLRKMKRFENVLRALGDLRALGGGGRQGFRIRKFFRSAHERPDAQQIAEKQIAAERRGQN